MEFCSSRYLSQNGQRSTLRNCKIWLWRLRFPCSSLFYFLAIDVQKGMNASFLIPLESLHFNLQSLRSAQNIDWRSNLPITSNLLLFTSFIQKYLQNIKQRISRYYIYIYIYIYNIGKILVKCGWNYWIIWLHHSPCQLPVKEMKKVKLNIRSVKKHNIMNCFLWIFLGFADRSILHH